MKKIEERNLMPVQFTNHHIKVIQDVVGEWTERQSVTRATEELAELIVELQKSFRCATDGEWRLQKRCIKLEMADVKIALKHLEILFGNYQQELDSKMQRLERRIDK